MRKEEAVIMQCYLSKSGDQLNKVVEYAGSLHIIHQGKSTLVDLKKIKSVQIQPKKLIIALVGGGIGTSLSMLALQLGWYNYNFNILSIFFFFAVMYWGFIGQKALVIDEGNHQHVFLLRHVHDRLQPFISHLYKRMRVTRQAAERPIFHLTTLSTWKEQISKPSYSHPSLESEGFIHCSLVEDLAKSYQLYFDPSTPMVVLMIHPNQLTVNIEWEYVNDREANFPHVLGPINKESIMNAVVFQGEEDLALLIQ